MKSTVSKGKLFHSDKSHYYEKGARSEESYQFRSDSENHHRNMLENISSLIEAENLTDMTIQCSEGIYVHTHKQLLSSVSSLARKLSREHNGLGDNQRLHLIIDDVSRQTVLHFLKILYTGYTEALRISDFDEIHNLCQLLGITINDSSVFNFSPLDRTLGNKSKERRQTDKNNALGEGSLSLGSGNPIPSDCIVKYTNISKDNEKSKEISKKDCISSKVKRQKNDLGKIKGQKQLKEKNDKNERTVYCICREEERPGMIGCDNCDEWYHTQCLSLSKDEVKRLSNENWSCPNCEFRKVKTKRHSSTESSRSHKTTSVTHNISIKSADADIRTNSTNNEKYSNENSYKASSTPSIESLSDDNQLVQKKNRKRRSTTDQDSTTQDLLREEKKDYQPSKIETSKSTAKLDFKTEKRSTPDDKKASVHNDEKCDSKITSKSINSSDNSYETKENKSSKSNANETFSGTTSPYTLTNKRMTVPQQKKPKKSFEEALFEGIPSSVSIKRQSTSQEDTSITTSRMNKEKFVKNKKLKDEKPTNNLHEGKRIVLAENCESENRRISPTKSQNQATVIDNSTKNEAEKSGLDSRFDERTCSIELSSSQKKEKTANSTNQLFFCYSCKSIFVSSAALELHKKKMGHFE